MAFEAIWKHIWPIVSHPAATFIEGIVVTRFIEIMFDRYKNRKKLSIRRLFGSRTDVHGGKSTDLVVRNVGTVPLLIHGYGYRTWDGGGIDQKKVHILESNLEPEHEDTLPFYDGTEGKNIQIPEESVYFYFVETGSKVFRKYTIWRPIAWLKRIRIMLKA